MYNVHAVFTNGAILDQDMDEDKLDRFLANLTVRSVVELQIERIKTPN